MVKRNFFYDILRDKGSYKYSTTKSFALLFTIFILIYMVAYLFILKKPVDLGLIGETFVLIAGLLGLKNNWGRRSSTSHSSYSFDEPSYDIDSAPKNIDKTQNYDEAVF